MTYFARNSARAARSALGPSSTEHRLLATALRVPTRIHRRSSQQSAIRRTGFRTTLARIRDYFLDREPVANERRVRSRRRIS